MISDLKSDLVMTTSQRRPNVHLMGNPAVCHLHHTGSAAASGPLTQPLLRPAPQKMSWLYLSPLPASAALSHHPSLCSLCCCYQYCRSSCLTHCCLLLMLFISTSLLLCIVVTAGFCYFCFRSSHTRFCHWSFDRLHGSVGHTTRNIKEGSKSTP